MRVSNLRCEYTQNPLGIDIRKPRLSWELEDAERGRRQTAYQILVASRKDLLDAGQGDVWDSEKVNSAQSGNIVYAGDALQSGTLYYWTVRIWDSQDQAGPYNAAATFETGLFDPDEWQGRWICSEGNDGPLLRKAFHLDKPVKRARLYISGIGYYEARINGNKVGDHVLDPGWTDYDKTILYSSFDVTQLLRIEGNVLGVMLGNGRFSPPDHVVKKTPMILKKYLTHPIVIAQLQIEFSDDSSLTLSTDSSWKATLGPIVSNDIYDGERYDARLEKFGWDQPGYDDSDWPSAQEAQQPSGQLISQAGVPAIKICQTMQPQRLTIPQPGVYIYDFGQNFTGWVRLRVSGQRGAEVTIRHAELLNPDGTLNTIPNRTAAATDTYILKGEGIEEFEPRFTYHGFRYVEVTGFPGTAALSSIEGKVVHSSVESRGSFLCSTPLINQIHQNILWGQVSNLMSIPTDCPQRDERMGWMGDAQLIAEESVYNFDMAGFFSKWLRDIRDAQAEDGSVPDVVPMYWPMLEADPAWGTACMVIPWTLYQYYGDHRILEENYTLMQRYVEFLHSIAHDDVLNYGKYGDWCPPWHVNSVDTPQEMVSQWHYYRDSLLLSKIAEILDKTEDAEKYRAQAERIGAVFNKKFLHGTQYGGPPYPWYRRLIPKTATDDEARVIDQHLAETFAVRSQTGDVLALVLDLVPEEKREAVLKGLINDIIVVHGTHINTGIVGTRYILDVLSDNGYAELAYKLITQTTYPGWGYMIQEGATTLWERWEYLTDVGMNSQNHIMLGSIDAWFYRYLAGIQIEPSTPGWRKILIKPHILGDLSFVSASVQTVKGLITSNWRKTHDALELEVTVPIGSQAVISIPKLGWQDVAISEGGAVMWQNHRLTNPTPGVSDGRETPELVEFRIDSGSYCFTVRPE